jgi:hypothetical protein
MGVYNDAMVWANERGDGSGATCMRKALMSLYSSHWLVPIGEMLRRLDTQGRALLFACMTEYARNGETDELRTVGDAIRSSGRIDDWAKIMEAAHEAEVRMHQD